MLPKLTRKNELVFRQKFHDEIPLLTDGLWLGWQHARGNPIEPKVSERNAWNNSGLLCAVY